MKSKSLLTLVTVLFMSVLAVNAQSVDDVVAKAITAMGGYEKVKSVKTIKMHINLEMQGQKIPITMTMKKPNMMYQEVEVQGMKIVQAYDGKSGWSVNPMSGKTEAEATPAEMNKSMDEQASFESKLVDYKQKGYTAELLGKDDFEGTEVFKIKLTKKEDVITYFIDATSYLVLKERTKSVYQGKEIEADNILSDYKSVDGYMVAHSMEAREVDSAEGQKLIIESVELNPKVEDSLFKIPAKK